MRDTSRDPWGNRRAYSVGGQARFVNPPQMEPVPRAQASLPRDHPAIVEGRTVFPSRVFDARQRAFPLIAGINNANTGNMITVGAWAGCRMFNLSLEERATCPNSCALWRECFGNGMPMAVRFRYNDALMLAIERQMEVLSRARACREGFAVRLHILGDFPDMAYLRQWQAWLKDFRLLHVWGYTAHPPGSELGRSIAATNRNRSDRWQIRFSVPEVSPHAPGQVTTTWRKPDRYSYDPANSSIVCPQEIGKTAHCATCGICWKPEMAHVRVTFLGHGGHSTRTDTIRPASRDALVPPTRREVVPMPVRVDAGDEAAAIAAFLARNGATKLPAAKARGAHG